ncbi:MAG: hypothetical protein GWO81_04720 [Verrucomicrobia bacterium]|nr:hypothetical protein [Verrucomicrobiota bacterium]
MRINPINTVLLLTPFVLLCSAMRADDTPSLQARISNLEARLVALEERLATNEQATEAAQIMAVSNGAGLTGGNSLANSAALDIMANSAWRNLRWTRPVQWQGVVPGISEEKVIEFLGKPPRSVKSLKPRVDYVFYYETSLGDQNNALSGRISFRDGMVIAVRKPNFQAKEIVQ